MTQEDLKTIYERAKQYVIAKYNTEPISIEIEENGTLSAEYLEGRGCCGDPDEYSHYYFTIDNLTSDLDVLVKERKIKEAEQAEKDRIRREEETKRWEAQRKRERRQQYLKLKEEFES